MFYRGHDRRLLVDLKHLLVQIITRDDRLSRLEPFDRLGPTIVTADADDRDAFLTLLQRCQDALAL